jgi:hypothetical protein
MNRDFPHSLVFEELTSELLATGHGFRFQARGRSMLPVIQDGEILHVRPLRQDKLSTGDIVLFRANEEFKAHRITSKQGDLLFTRGDAGLEVDGAITRGQILGIVIAKECAQSGQIIRLSGFLPRSTFRLRKARTWARLMLNFGRTARIHTKSSL